MRKWTSTSTCWAIISAVLFLMWPETCFAIDTATRAAARDIATEGVDAYQAGDYPKAMERLERAYKVLPLPSLALWSARALEKNGLLLEASERYLEATRLSTEGAGEKQVQIDAQVEAEEEREALRARIPKVIVNIEGAPPEEVDVTINGVVVAPALYGAGRPSNPGDIEVVAKRGEHEEKGRLTLKEGDEKQITLHFNDALAPSPIPAAAPKNAQGPTNKAAPAQTTNFAASPTDVSPPKGSSWQKTVGWIGIGVGGAALIAGGVIGYVAMQKNEELADNCPDRVCGPDQFGNRYVYNQLRLSSSVGFIAGGVLTAAGITLLATAPKVKSSASVTPYVGLASAGFTGAF